MLRISGSLRFLITLLKCQPYESPYILCVSLGAAITNIDTLISIGLSTTEGLAVDWVTKHLYWVESNLDQIEVANFNGTDRMTLIAGGMNSPRAIAVDPRKG